MRARGILKKTPEVFKVSAKNFVHLLTPEGEALRGQPWRRYPRPQLRRDSFFCLNGLWDFAALCADEAPETFPENILVPFAPESLLSGIHRTFPKGVRFFYRTTFTLPDGFRKARVLLHFGAVDQHAEVWLNGARLGAHTGGYDPFTFDITEHLLPQNTLLVRATDDLDRSLPYGKQRRKRGGMWYTPVSGIWQTVWLESVPQRYIRRAENRHGRARRAHRHGRCRHGGRSDGACVRGRAALSTARRVRGNHARRAESVVARKPIPV